MNNAADPGRPTVEPCQVHCPCFYNSTRRPCCVCGQPSAESMGIDSDEVHGAAAELADLLEAERKDPGVITRGEEFAAGIEVGEKRLRERLLNEDAIDAGDGNLKSKGTRMTTGTEKAMTRTTTQEEQGKAPQTIRFTPEEFAEFLHETIREAREGDQPDAYFVVRAVEKAEGTNG